MEFLGMGCTREEPKRGHDGSKPITAHYCPLAKWM